MANLSIGSTAPPVLTASADRLRLDLLTLNIQAQADLEPAFERAVAWGADMLVPSNVVPLNVPRDLVPTLALRWRLPASSQALAWTQAGLLLSYSGSLTDIAHRAAEYTARILNGADPAVLPIEISTVFDLAVNRRTLAHLGLSLPPRWPHR